MSDNPSRCLRRIPEKFIASQVDGELILIHGESGAFYSLTDVGLDIWDQIETPKLLSEISQDLEATYQVEPQVCSAAVSNFADDLVRAGLAEYT